MAYHSAVWGWITWRLKPPHFLVSDYLDTFRQISIDYSDYLIYTDFRTFVCVYREVHRMKGYKEKLIKLLDKLTPNQIEYLYYLVTKLFGQAPD